MPPKRMARDISSYTHSMMSTGIWPSMESTWQMEVELILTVISRSHVSTKGCRGKGGREGGGEVGKE